MTDRRGDEGYAVAPVRIGGPSSRGPHRGRRIGVIVVAGIGLAIVTAAWIGPRLEGRPNFDVAFFATPVPSATATATATPTTAPFGTVGPTPLPAVTRATDQRLIGTVDIWTEAIRVLDLETGLLSAGSTANPGLDAVVPAPDGSGLLCVCMSDRPMPDSKMERDVQIVRISAAGEEQTRRTVVTLRGQSDLNGTSGTQTDVDVSSDGRTALLVSGERTADGWDFAVRVLDLLAVTTGPAAPLGHVDLPLPVASAAPSPSPSAGQLYTDVYGPVVRQSPDGARAFVWATIQQYTDNGVTANESFGWRVDLARGGAVGTVEAAPGLAGLPPYCNSAAFLRDDAFVAVCTVNSPSGSASPWRAIELDRDAGNVAQMEIQNTQNWYSEPLFDRANSLVWLWDATGQTLVQIDVGRLSATSRHYDPLVDRAAGDPPLAGVAPIWVRPTSSVGRYATTEMTGAPDGSRIYLIGYGVQDLVDSQGPPSVGVFVVDPTTLALVDRWDPAAQYVSVQPILDGSVIAVAGAAGVNAAGQSAPWQSSLTLHDAKDGRILVRFGQLGDNYYPFLVGP